MAIVSMHATAYEASGYGLTKSASFMDRVLVKDTAQSLVFKGTAFNIIQPVVAVYAWRRQA